MPEKMEVQRGSMPGQHTSTCTGNNTRAPLPDRKGAPPSLASGHKGRGGLRPLDLSESGSAMSAKTTLPDRPWTHQCGNPEQTEQKHCQRRQVARVCIT